MTDLNRIRNYLTRDGLNYSQIADELGLDNRTSANQNVFQFFGCVPL